MHESMVYSYPADWAAIMRCFLSFFWLTFLGPADSVARGTAISRSERMISTWHGEAM